MKYAIPGVMSVILLVTSANAFAQCPPNCRGFTTAVPVGRSFDRKILSIQPDTELVEHQDITIGFELAVTIISSGSSAS